MMGDYFDVGDYNLVDMEAQPWYNRKRWQFSRQMTETKMTEYLTGPGILKTWVATSELRKGARVKLANGWLATIEDNFTKRATRLATVEGIVTEMGEVYAHEIVEAEINGAWVKVRPSKSQLELKRSCNEAGWP